VEYIALVRNREAYLGRIGLEGVSEQEDSTPFECCPFVVESISKSARERGWGSRTFCLGPSAKSELMFLLGFWFAQIG
jgi:hypothetical protein